MRILRARQLSLLVWLLAWALVHAQLGLQTAPESGARILNSPDETANFFFATRVAAVQPIFAPSGFGAETGGIVHPRSMAIHRGNLVPLSFLGLPLWYGLAGRWVGTGTILWLTPLVAVLGAWAAYQIFREFFGERVAWVAAALLPVLPPWWYYSARGLFHNVPFTALLLAAGWAMVSLYRHGRALDAGASGLALGLALTFRTVEAVWVLPLVVLVTFALRRRWRRTWWWLLIGFVVVWIPVLIQQFATYGNPWQVGYLLPPAIDGQAETATAWLPFGILPRRAAENAFRFTFGLLPWICWPALLGAIIIIHSWRRQLPSRRWYVIGLGAVGAVLFGYYGSAYLTDNLDPRALTLGTSYVRYWLPWYVAALPLAIFGWQWITGYLPGGRFSHWCYRGLACVAVAVLSIQLTWREPMEGLGAVERAVAAGYAKRARVAAIVEDNAVIVAERSDKLFFPTYAVVSTLLDGRTNRYLTAVLAQRPVYYYTFLNDIDLQQLKDRLNSARLALTEPVVIDADAPSPERLFRLVAP